MRRTIVLIALVLVSTGCWGRAPAESPVPTPTVALPPPTIDLLSLSPARVWTMPRGPVGWGTPQSSMLGGGAGTGPGGDVGFVLAASDAHASPGWAGSCGFSNGTLTYPGDGKAVRRFLSHPASGVPEAGRPLPPIPCGRPVGNSRPSLRCPSIVHWYSR